MIQRLLDWVAGKEPVATATGLAAVVTAALGAGAAFGLPVTPEQIAAIGALAAALAGYLGRRVVTPVESPADRKIARLLSRSTDTVEGDSRIEGGSVPLALIILVALGVIVMGGLAFCGDALFEDENERNDIGLVELSSHEYCAADHDYCGRAGGYEDERGGRGGRDKRTCFFGCDNIIVIPNPLDPGGGNEPREPRTAHA